LAPRLDRRRAGRRIGHVVPQKSFGLGIAPSSTLPRKKRSPGRAYHGPGRVSIAATAATGTVLAGLLVVGLVQVVPAGASPRARPKPAGVDRSQRKGSIVIDTPPGAQVSSPVARLVHRSRLVRHASALYGGDPQSAVSSRPPHAVRTRGQSVTRPRPAAPKDAGTASLMRGVRATTAKTKVRSAPTAAAIKRKRTANKTANKRAKSLAARK
jgi:hypothetical protein